MMKFGLHQESIDKINSVFEKHSEIDSVIIYGSRAKGNYRAGSDIDLSLFGEDLNLELVHKISSELDASNSPYLFDISIFSKLTSDSLKDHINRVGQIFYKRKSN